MLGDDFADRPDQHARGVAHAGLVEQALRLREALAALLLVELLHLRLADAAHAGKARHGNLRMPGDELDLGRLAEPIGVGDHVLDCVQGSLGAVDCQQEFHARHFGTVDRLGLFRMIGACITTTSPLSSAISWPS